MGHYAKIVNNKVVKVIVATQDFIDGYSDNEPELTKYPSSWVKTSYNTRGGVHYQPNTDIPSEDQSKSLRKNFAGIGYTYDEIKDAFIPPKPFDSWLLNEETCLWESPTPYPTDGNEYVWDETSRKWAI
jgi:hypothetical protein